MHTQGSAFSHEVPLCTAQPSPGWIGRQSHSWCIQPSAYEGGAGEGLGSHSVHVGGAEVIHFGGKINDTINTRLGHCSGGQGTIYAHCWQPGPWAHTVILRCTSSDWTHFCGSCDLSSTHRLNLIVQPHVVPSLCILSM